MLLLELKKLMGFLKLYKIGDTILWNDCGIMRKSKILKINKKTFVVLDCIGRKILVPKEKVI